MAGEGGGRGLFSGLDFLHRRSTPRNLSPRNSMSGVVGESSGGSPRITTKTRTPSPRRTVNAKLPRVIQVISFYILISIQFIFLV